MIASFLGQGSMDAACSIGPPFSPASGGLLASLAAPRLSASLQAHSLFDCPLRRFSSFSPVRTLRRLRAGGFASPPSRTRSFRRPSPFLRTLSGGFAAASSSAPGGSAGRRPVRSGGRRSPRGRPPGSPPAVVRTLKSLAQAVGISHSEACERRTAASLGPLRGPERVARPPFACVLFVLMLFF